MHLHLLKPLMASALMAVVLKMLGGSPLYLLIPLGICTYLVALRMIGGISANEVRMLKQAIQGAEIPPNG